MELTSQVAGCGLLCAPRTNSKCPHETEPTHHVPERQVITRVCCDCGEGKQGAMTADVA